MLLIVAKSSGESMSRTRLHRREMPGSLHETRISLALEVHIVPGNISIRQPSQFVATQE